MRITSFRSAFAAAFLALAVAAAYFAPGLRAQTPSNPAPYNTDLGAVITNALRTAGTVTTDPQYNTNWRGVVCTFGQTASSGSSSVSFGIQGYDSANNTWLTYVQQVGLQGNPSITAGIPYTLMIYPGIQTTGLPAGTTALNVHLPRTWRVTQTIAEGTGGTGRGPAATGKIGCNYLL